ncbi:LysR family transcriptional regulator [Thalassomonas haliotis]|uniref:LysR family transcriptional regulator n=1 Tax=Thalassomonas haliotis TaxID=485448 RepID=A0ABY7VFA0_9GAMM|nr:LysR family transcriptional regulator [Thalassomonas haliotis]WDE11573.1 LysR family transcriptional regulator [Thalassomonas haliotis]
MSKMPITIEALLVIDAIDRRQSFAKAAEEMNKATSALSYIMQKLEENLGITLFERQGRRSVLTAAGKVVLEEGRQILQASTQLVEKARETSTGWETHLKIAIESTGNYKVFFTVLQDFLKEHPSIEVEVSECVLSGGWDALEHNQIDLVVGAPGPIPLLKGFRSVPMAKAEMVPVIAADHEYAEFAEDGKSMLTVLSKIRRIVIPDTSKLNVTRSAGLTNGYQKLYVQNMDQKLAALRAGLGVGHLPRKRITEDLANGSLLQLKLDPANDLESFLAWKISNKGKALRALTQLLEQADWSDG